MPIYIIRPKAKAVTHSLNLTAKKFTPESRQPQLEEVISLWKENKTYQTIQDWVKYTQTTDELRVIKERNQPGVTGTVIVQMSA
jgi:hypothetical protein